MSIIDDGIAWLKGKLAPAAEAEPWRVMTDTMTMENVGGRRVDTAEEMRRREHEREVRMKAYAHNVARSTFAATGPMEKVERSFGRDGLGAQREGIQAMTFRGVTYEGSAVPTDNLTPRDQAMYYLKKDFHSEGNTAFTAMWRAYETVRAARTEAMKSYAESGSQQAKLAIEEEEIKYQSYQRAVFANRMAAETARKRPSAPPGVIPGPEPGREFLPLRPGDAAKPLIPEALRLAEEGRVLAREYNRIVIVPEGDRLDGPVFDGLGVVDKLPGWRDELTKAPEAEPDRLHRHGIGGAEKTMPSRAFHEYEGPPSYYPPRPQEGQLPALHAHEKSQTLGQLSIGTAKDFMSDAAAMGQIISELGMQGTESFGVLRPIRTGASGDR